MPWSETTKMRERMRFVLDAEEGLLTMTENDRAQTSKGETDSEQPPT